jgi:hypothetical protein
VSGDSEAVDWRKLREFADVDLARSFVLSWQFEAETLLIDTDIHLLPNHPFYETPRPAEKVCIRPALIEFPYCVGISLGGSSIGRGPSASVRGLGNGAITGLRRYADGRYELRGDFGRVTIEAERPILRLEGS